MGNSGSRFSGVTVLLQFSPKVLLKRCFTNRIAFARHLSCPNSAATTALLRHILFTNSQPIGLYELGATSVQVVVNTTDRAEPISSAHIIVLALRIASSPPSHYFVPRPTPSPKFQNFANSQQCSKIVSNTRKKVTEVFCLSTRTVAKISP